MKTSELSRSQRGMQIERRTSQQWAVAAIGVCIPSQTKPGVRYFTTCDTCSCPDSQYRRATCKHQLAARIFMGRQK